MRNGGKRQNKTIQHEIKCKSKPSRIALIVGITIRTSSICLIVGGKRHRQLIVVGECFAGKCVISRFHLDKYEVKFSEYRCND